MLSGSVNSSIGLTYSNISITTAQEYYGVDTEETGNQTADTLNAQVNAYNTYLADTTLVGANSDLLNLYTGLGYNFAFCERSSRYSIYNIPPAAIGNTQVAKLSIRGYHSLYIQGSGWSDINENVLNLKFTETVSFGSGSALEAAPIDMQIPFAASNPYKYSSPDYYMLDLDPSVINSLSGTQLLTWLTYGNVTFPYIDKGHRLFRASMANLHLWY